MKKKTGAGMLFLACTTLSPAGFAQSDGARETMSMTQGQTVDIDLSQGQWQLEEQTWVWRYRLENSGAGLIAFAADHRLAGDAELRMQTDSGVQRTEQLDAASAPRYYSPPLRGEVLHLQLRVAKRLPDEAFRIVTRYASPVTAKSTGAGTVPANAQCEMTADTARPARSTVGLLISSAGGQVSCSGTLVNDMTGTGAHRILSAAHCGRAAQHDGGSVRVYWNATSNCADGLSSFVDSGALSSIGYRTLVVATVANGPTVTNSDGDHWLLASDVPPPQGSAPVWAGLDAQVRRPPQAPGIDSRYYPTSVIAAVFALSHPLALTQSIALYTNSDVGGEFEKMLDGARNFTFDPNQYDGISSYTFYYDARRFSVLPGSSGSALRLPDGRVIGVLSASGSPDQIHPTNGQFVQSAQYDKLYAVWRSDQMGSPSLDIWLDPESTGRRVSDEYRDLSRTDNLGVQFASLQPVVAAGGALDMEWLLDDAVSCERESTPALAQWQGAQTVVNGAVQSGQITLPDNREYRLALRCQNAAGFVQRREIVVNRSTTSVPVTAPGGDSTPDGSAGNGARGGGDDGGGGIRVGAMAPLGLLLFALIAVFRSFYFSQRRAR